MKAIGDPWIKFAEAILQRPLSPRWHEDFLRWEQEADKSYLYDLLPHSALRKRQLIDKFVLLCFQHDIQPNAAAKLLQEKFADEPHCGSAECLHCMVASCVNRLVEFDKRFGRWPGIHPSRHTASGMDKQVFDLFGKSPGLPSQRVDFTECDWSRDAEA